ncbi:hypothetical protein F5B19DRAFT_90074 [Rostrohypoxylon terebratum]|nr:hypothetical protein F5B19DRAFT_90074 [Rostrohypoxylon terebratum]
MDPFSAIGLAGNIIAFLDFGYKLLSKSKDIYKSTTGTTTLNNELLSETRQLQGITEGLQMPGLAGLSDQELALKQLAAECSTVSSDLARLIDDLKAKNPNSKRESLRAAFRDWKKKDKKDELRSRLDRCRDQLNLQIVTLMRAESLDRLNKLVVYGQASSIELQSLVRNVETLQANCNVSCLNPEALGQIRSILGLTEEAVLKIRQARILNGLRFELMNERYEEIVDAHEKTFRWILNDEPEEDDQISERGETETETESTEESLSGSGNDSNDENENDEFPQENGSVENSRDYDGTNSTLSGCGSIDDDSSFEWSSQILQPLRDGNSEVESDLLSEEKSNSPLSDGEQPQSEGQSPELIDEAMIESRDRFIAWLKQGDGIFHIIGKPGSGKSTLMKYICRQPITEKYLQAWAGDSELVIGKFFFWRPGSALQKTFKGLIRGLLYCILSKSPELISKAFPEHWHASMHQENIHIEHHECQKGFEALLSPNATTPKKYRFVLFIDGLDEFGGDHANLIRNLFSWISNTHVKICVSSREWAIFQERFRDCPKIWLHELTHRDIRRMVQDRVREMDLHCLLGSKDTAISDHAETLENEICRGSDGVFLWVAIVLRHIENGLANGDQMEDLINVVRSFPTELEPCKSLKNYHDYRVHITYSTKSAISSPEIFRRRESLLSHTRCLLSIAVVMYQLISSIPSANKKLAYATLSFALNSQKYNTARLRLMQLALLEEYTKDRDFAMKIPIHSLDLPARQERARKRIYGICKGFLELHYVASSTKPIVISITRLFGNLVFFTHRSVVEFLEGQKFQEIAQNELQGFDPHDADIQIYLGLLRYLKLPRFYFVPKFACQDRLGLPSMESRSFHWTWAIASAPTPSFSVDLSRRIGLHTKLSLRDGPERVICFLDDVRRTIADLHLSTDKLFMGMCHARAELLRCPLDDLPFFLSTTMGFLEYVSRPCRVSSEALVGCINTALVQLMFQSPSPKLSRRLKILDTLLSRGGSIDFISSMKNSSILDFIMEGWCIRESKAPLCLQLIALFLYHGIDPEICFIISKRSYELKGYGIVRRAYWGKKVTGKGEIKKMMRLNLQPWSELLGSGLGNDPRTRPGGLIAIASDKFTTKHGFLLDLKALVSIWVPAHSNILREVLIWDCEVGVSLDIEQRIKSVQSKFGHELRSLFDPDHPDFVGWDAGPSEWDDMEIKFVQGVENLKKTST